MRLSNQALGALMLALQKSLLEQSDITEMLREFSFQLNENEELMVLNPPTVKFEKKTEEYPHDLEKINTVGSD